MDELQIMQYIVYLQCQKMIFFLCLQYNITDVVKYTHEQTKKRFEQYVRRKLAIYHYGNVFLMKS